MKKTKALLIAALITASLAGCGNTTTPEPAATESPAAETALTESAAEESTTAETTAESETATEAETADDTVVRVGSLKGPTSMGLVHLMDTTADSEGANYDFTMVAAADELLGKVVSGDLDIALIPANVSSVLYNKTQGGISVIDINTLGVLYIVSSDDSIKTIADLKGRTIAMTGKGNTPEYIMNYLLSANGLTADDVTLEFKSEAAEVASMLKEQPDVVGMLPQPFVTAALAQNEDLKILLDCTAEWEAVQGEGGSQLVTGVTVVRNDFLKEHKDLVDAFISSHEASALYTETNPDETAELIAAAGIIEKAPVALKALPYCNIVCITAEDMKTALSGYLEVLFDQDPASVGGTLPADDFYYIP